VPKSEPFTHKALRGGGGLVGRENRRTGLPRARFWRACWRSIRAAASPGIMRLSTPGRAWVMGGRLGDHRALRGRGRERVLLEHNVSRPTEPRSLLLQKRAALEIDGAVEGGSAHAGGLARALPGRRTAPVPGRIARSLTARRVRSEAPA